MDDRQILRRATRDLVLDSLIAPDLEPAEYSDIKLAQLYDEIMTAPSTQQVKEAAEVVEDQDPAVQDAAKVAEFDFLGRLAARTYVNEYLSGLQKVAQGLKGVTTRVLGRNPEERLQLDRMRREHELGLRPQEVSLELGESGARGALSTEQALQQLMLREAKQRQALGQQLRTLQLGDQHRRREREEQLYRALHGEREIAGPITHMLAGGAVGKLTSSATGKVLRGLAENAGGGAVKLPKFPGIRVGAAMGLGTYLARKLLTNPNPAPRTVTRLERERYSPASLTGDVQP